MTHTPTVPTDTERPAGWRRRAGALLASGLIAALVPAIAPAVAHADTSAPTLGIYDNHILPPDATHPSSWKPFDIGTDYTRAFGTGTTGGTDAAGYSFVPIMTSSSANGFYCPGDQADHPAAGHEIQLYLSPDVQTSLTAAGTAYAATPDSVQLPQLEPYSTRWSVNTAGFAAYLSAYGYDSPASGGTGLYWSSIDAGSRAGATNPNGAPQAVYLGDDGYWTANHPTSADPGAGTDMSTIGGLASVMAPGHKYTFGLACTAADPATPQTFNLVPDPANSSQYASVQSYLTVNTDGSWDLNASPTTAIGTTTTLAADSATSNAGDPVTLTATVPTGLAGSVDFYSGTTKVGTATVTPGTETQSGTAVLTTTSLPAGNDSLTATFNPDNSTADQYHQFGASTSTALTHRVNAVNTTTTVSATSSRYGTASHVTVKVTATGTTPTGTITLTGAGATQTAALTSAGTAAFTLARTLTPRSYTLAASYTGDDASSVGHATLRIAKTAPGVPAVKVTAKPTRKRTGKATITVATRAGLVKATGRVTVTLKLGKKTVRVAGTLRSGRVTVKLPKLTKKGTWKLTAAYAGNSYYTARTSKTLTIRVK